MKALVTGSNGQLGYDLLKELNKRNIEAVGVDIDEMDITNAQSVKNAFEKYKPDWVFHCAAWTAVDKAEDMPEKCEKVNAIGTKNIAEMCKRTNCKLIYLSTDYVFSGDGTNFWEPDDKVNPLNTYGKTKYMGEQFVREVPKHYIVRISWVFGINGNNFVKTMIKLGTTKDEVKVVNDQIGSPTYTADLAVLLCDMAEADKYGTYHATNEGLCSWYDFAKEIFSLCSIKTKLTAVSSSEFVSKAKRPQNSRMNKAKLEENSFNRLPNWQDALKRYLKELGEI